MCKESADEQMLFHMGIEIRSVFNEVNHDPIIVIDRAVDSPQSVQ